MSSSSNPLKNYPNIKSSILPTPSLTYHILSSGIPSNPLIICLHGFPELAYSYRKILTPLADLGYHVVAFDQRGYGQTTGWDAKDYASVDLESFRFTALVRDVLRLVKVLGYDEVACVIGSDFGAGVAALCALVRPDVFKSAVIMTHPFKGTPPIVPPPKPIGVTENIHKTLAELETPRRHYKWYCASEPAASEMLNPKEDLALFLRRYYHLKSASWPGNEPCELKSFTATELEKVPLYYVMPLHSTMREAVEQSISAPPYHGDTTASETWLPDDELQYFVDDYARVGFQGGLNWYRILTDYAQSKELELWADKTIDVPTMFIAGNKDWGPFQEPGALEGMQRLCTNWKGSHLVEGAGHWVQQEQPEKVVELIRNFLGDLDK